MKRSVVLLVLMLAMRDSAAPVPAQRVKVGSDEPAPLVVLFEKGPQGTICRVDGRDVTANPLRGIADAYEQHGARSEYPVFAVIDDRLPIRMLSEASGLVGKVGFSNVRYFRLAVDVGKMGEISFGKVYPFPGYTR